MERTMATTNSMLKSLFKNLLFILFLLFQDFPLFLGIATHLAVLAMTKGNWIFPLSGGCVIFREIATGGEPPSQ